MNAAPPTGVDKDVPKLRGEWQAVEAVINGAANADWKRPWVFGERAFLFKLELPIRGSYNLDSAATPKRVTFRFVGGGTARTMDGIYELDDTGATLTLCLYPDRPPLSLQEAMRKKKGYIIITLAREEP